ncbi:hypothetical protein ACS5PN_12385 [Roseateles sp. NT4]|uniref:hypothetical protein n=1 Tax=Roseateles sp. NT4 TaxID=3453715 RepID=UPI003EECDC93
MTTQQFTADGSVRDRLKYALKPLGAALVLPPLAYGFLGATVGNALTMLVVGLAVTLPLIWGRRSWGKTIAIHAGDIQVTRRDGSVLAIASSAITALLNKADCVGVVWQDGQKRRSLVIGGEGFSPQTWHQLTQAFQALDQQRKQAAVAAP